MDNCASCLCSKVNRLASIVAGLQTGETTVKVGTTSTLTPGSDAVVVNSGTDTHVVLNFGIPAGENGVSPHIGPNGNWFVGTTDTGVKATGANGTSPTIGVNGNWFIGATDTGVHAQGSQGVAATVNVGTTTTLAPGNPASVTNVGTTSNAIFNFAIPQGAAGAGSNNVYAGMLGVLLNDNNQPSQVVGGARIPWKSINNNQQGLLKPAPDTSYFQFTQLGRYLCIFSLRCAVKTSGDNGVINWGLYAQSIAKAMVTSASTFVTTNMSDISGVGIFDVTDLNEHYNLVNNSNVTILAQGATATQTFYDDFLYFNGVNQIDGMSVVFIRLGSATI